MAPQSIHITDIEAAINYWRLLKPSPDGVTLAGELRALAEVYALMIYHHQDEAAEQGFPPKAYAAWRTWYDTTPDTPCIAICSTSQGDPVCKGCGRSFEEVQYWTEMSPGPSAMCGGASLCRARPGGLTATRNGLPRVWTRPQRQHQAALKRAQPGLPPSRYK